MPNAVIDDHLLLTVLLGGPPPQLTGADVRLFTTGLWYHRLCRALGTTAVTGAISRLLGDVGSDIGSRALLAVVALPESIEMLSLRDLGWPMARLIEEGVRLNLMSLEALAAAEHLDADIWLETTDKSPTLLAAAVSRGIGTHLIAL